MAISKTDAAAIRIVVESCPDLRNVGQQFSVYQITQQLGSPVLFRSSARLYRNGGVVGLVDATQSASLSPRLAAPSSLG
jgi:hypothetical protein